MNGAPPTQPGVRSAGHPTPETRERGSGDTLPQASVRDMDTVMRVRDACETACASVRGRTFATRSRVGAMCCVQKHRLVPVCYLTGCVEALAFQRVPRDEQTSEHIRRYDVRTLTDPSEHRGGQGAFIGVEQVGPMPDCPGPPLITIPCTEALDVWPQSCAISPAYRTFPQRPDTHHTSTTPRPTATSLLLLEPRPPCS